MKNSKDRGWSDGRGSVSKDREREWSVSRGSEKADRWRLVRDPAGRDPEWREDWVDTQGSRVLVSSRELAREDREAAI